MSFLRHGKVVPTGFPFEAGSSLRGQQSIPSAGRKNNSAKAAARFKHCPADFAFTSYYPDIEI
jgi:hypothetical protein